MSSNAKKNGKIDAKNCCNNGGDRYHCDIYNPYKRSRTRKQYELGWFDFWDGMESRLHKLREASKVPSFSLPPQRPMMFGIPEKMADFSELEGRIIGSLVKEVEETHAKIATYGSSCHILETIDLTGLVTDIAPEDLKGLPCVVGFDPGHHKDKSISMRVRRIDGVFYFDDLEELPDDPQTKEAFCIHGTETKRLK